MNPLYLEIRAFGPYADVQAIGGQELIDAEQAGHDAEHQHHGQVGQQK